MTHFKITSPDDPDAFLERVNQNNQPTIYQCQSTKKYWMLHTNQAGEQFLYRYLIDGEKKVIDKSQRFDVPKDWTGDPEIICVSEDCITDIKMGANDSVNLSQYLMQHIENGDEILVTSPGDEESQVIGKVIKDGDNIYLNRL
ncbi:hypothetical protein Enr10x_31540 [Gimesia panareensis]|uniref:Uncharacterized protein n=1 Tax=Gimesia panareensis TaxID=2527978 RepID=A0A517Q864_9PLAN|nr:hypothetical protein [Gimesia panareensis]QDT27820.1 hypothetical protein Enr10x_31540 [Gimesia panareensis]